MKFQNTFCNYETGFTLREATLIIRLIDNTCVDTITQCFHTRDQLWLQSDNDLYGACLHYGGAHAIKDSTVMNAIIDRLTAKKMMRLQT